MTVPSPGLLKQLEQFSQMWSKIHLKNDKNVLPSFLQHCNSFVGHLWFSSFQTCLPSISIIQGATIIRVCLCFACIFPLHCSINESSREPLFRQGVALQPSAGPGPHQGDPRKVQQWFLGVKAASDLQRAVQTGAAQRNHQRPGDLDPHMHSTYQKSTVVRIPVVVELMTC